MSFIKYRSGLTEGPLGFPLTDKQASALETILKALPRDSAFNYRKAVVAGGAKDGRGALCEVACGERSDVSWISTEDPDRMGEVVSAKGMSDSQFRLNPIVTLNHCYDIPPVGKSLWRKFVKDGDLRGIKAKTQYPARPADWKESKDWPADVAFSLVQADLLRGKSIGFLPVKVHTPTTHEVEQWQARSASKGEPMCPGTLAGGSGLCPINLVIDEWILLEYACVFLPAQQNAVVESVSKGFAIPEEFQKVGGLQIGNLGLAAANVSTKSAISNLQSEIPFTRVAEIEKAIQRQIEAIDIKAVCGLTKKTVEDRLDLLRGRV